ncbi:hypothetical protein [Prosthecobacter vanneervenii]|uniref:Uncharacterized protein n=1 Tax=Prosthecobacter vanneervenii TaxID=48466 RepID=A0A7W7YD96_9BACT|nr:hypothetical protein [Prosthecobacter vanneervenii]MBB5034063.1 hypothetical protein [Prosthecobacter vanneervenii]
MKTVPCSRIASIVACLFMAASASAETAANCTEISNDVKVAVEKDPSKVLMVVEDALVINEGCAHDIVKTAIIASKADSAMANQIVQTAVSVAPKMAGVINDAATSAIPGLAINAPAPAPAPVASNIEYERPVMPVSGKNPDKNPVVPVSKEPDFFVPSTIRGVFLLMPPASGPIPPRTNTNPVSPSNSIP